MCSDFLLEHDAVDLPRGATAGARRLKISWRGRAITALSQSDFRTYLYPVFTPAGVSVTAEAPIDHPHHNSITVGADRFMCKLPYSTDRFEEATYNFYVNQTFQGRAPGRTWGVSVDSTEVSPSHLQLVQQVQWQGPPEWSAPERRVLAEETRTFDIRPGDTANVIDVRSSLRPTEWEIAIGPTRHAYFTVRLADGLRAVDGGTLVDSEGREGAGAISGQLADWVDGSGPGAHGRKAGITVVPHVSTAGRPWLVYDWGTITVNPFAERGHTLRPGEVLEVGVRVLAHDGDATEAGVAEMYESSLRELRR